MVKSKDFFIAREIFRKPEILILDEATSALDSESERVIQDSVRFLMGQMTIIIVAHRLSTIKNVDYVCVLERGINRKRDIFTA